MSTSNSAERNIPESNFQKRIIGLDRFNLSDEDLHNIRIHVAVFKYNNPKNNTCVRTMNDKRHQLAPFKRKLLLKNSMKKRACDDVLDETKNLKRSCNRYQGVGNFPTVHLNKSPVPSKPFKRHTGNELKVQYPELPMNRFINHIPDLNLNLDLKSSGTRSVLDVLQDLSRKRIHSKDELDNTKLKPKGLGGDVPLDIEAPYKPLFVPKTKSSAVLTKDGATQTQESVGPSPELPSTSNSSNITTPSAYDPKAELRRKLAKQNNEIFASLSSSSFSPFSIKRKLRNSLALTENGGQDEDDPLKKRPRLATKDLNLKISKGSSKLNSSFGKSCSSNLDKSNKSLEKGKNLTTTASSSPKPQSPGRDRLMNIYFDMQNGNPKANIFQNNVLDENGETYTSREQQPTLGPSPKKSVSFNEQVTVLTFNNAAKDDSESSKEQDDKNSLISSSSVASSSTVVTSETKTDAPSFSFGGGKTSGKNLAEVSTVTVSEATTISSTTTASTFNFTSSSPTSSPGSGLRIPLTSTVSSPLTEKPIFSTGMPSNQEKVTPDKTNSSQFTFGSGETRNPEGSGFGSQLEVPETNKFSAASPTINSLGTTNSTSASQAKETPATSSALSGIISSTFTGINPATNFESKTLFAIPQFGSLNNVSGSKQPQFTFGSNAAPTSVVPTSTFENETPMFSFGSSQQNLTVPKTNLGSAPQSTAPTTTVVSTAPIFSFGQKATQGQDSPLQNQTVIFGQNTNVSSSSTAATPLKNNAPVTTPLAVSFSSSTPPNVAFCQNSSSTSPFTFGQKITNGKTTDLVESKSQPNFTFTFGQKRANEEAVANNSTSVSEGNAFGSKTNLFNFGQDSQASTACTAPSSTSIPAFGQNTTSQATRFGQTVTTQATGFGQTSSTQSTGFGSTAATSIGFGSTTTTLSAGFGQPSTTQITGFGQNTIVQSSPFGQVSIAQAPNFGQNTAPSFGQTTNTVSTSLASFGQTSTLSTQNVAFGQPVVTPSVTPFGQSQTTSSFGSNKAQPFSFGQSSTQSGFGQNSPLFNGNSKSTPSAFAPNPLFPAYGSNAATGQQPSTPTPVKPIPSFGQPSSGGFFNQTPTTHSQMPLFGQQTSTFGSTDTGFGQSSSSSLSAPAPAPFGQTSTQQQQQQSFRQTNQFSFGSSSSSASSTATATPPNTNASVFGFNAAPTSTNLNTSSSNFSFGSNATPASQPPPFAFGSQTNEPFKFGSSQNKSTPNFGSGSTSSPFAFGSQTNNNNNNNNNSISSNNNNNNNNNSNDPKPGTSVFSFGTGNNAAPTPSASAPGFNFGGGNVSTPVFSFGNSVTGSGCSTGGSSSSSSSNNNSAFSFGGTPQPNQNPFGSTPTQPPPLFPVPGTFSIGSGSSQTSSRPRGNSRLRRRP